ncbi:MAG: HAMP domain-containing protein [Anaerolineales bacterium]|nr:HAMP domain-containing protein [Anaerolineales bacterium]
MRSISTKLIIAFLSIGIVSVAVIFITARWNTRQEFIKFLSDQSQNNIVTNLTIYYQQNGSWEGVEFIFIQGNNRQMPGMGQGQGPRMEMMHPYLLTDRDGYVIVPNGRFKLGEKLSREQLELGVAITENGDVVGILIPTGGSFQGSQRELEFIERTNLTLLYGALIGAVIALFLGVFLSRTITRPIRELTKATHAVSEGDLTQRVAIRTNDELGELAQAFNKMSAELSRSVNARKQMTADIAHELRTPLSLILGHAEAVHDGVLPPAKENFEIIREEATRLEHLVDDLRTLSLADAGELSINLQTVEPGRLLQEVASLYQYQAQKKNIALELEVASPLPALEIDPGRMTQVLTNILDNATRHTPEGGHILLSAKQVRNMVELAIQDSGPGLPKEETERIFERFYRADASRRRDDGGSGLGLAIAKSIVQAHNGQLSAESEPGKGLRITISLPQKP